MTDKERVLMNIAIETGSCVGECIRSTPEGWRIRVAHGRPAAQFMSTGCAEAIGLPLKEGDIVRCFTNPNHDWGISEYVGIESSDGGAFGSVVWLLREIGGERILRMSNESLYVLRFMPQHLLLTGFRMKLWNWSQDAFTRRCNAKADRYTWRWGGCEFDGDCMTVWVRHHVFGITKMVDGVEMHAVPKKVTIPCSRKTRRKDIVAAVNEATKTDCEWSEKEPTVGMVGCARITRRDLLDALGLGSGNELL